MSDKLCGYLLDHDVDGPELIKGLLLLLLKMFFDMACRREKKCKQHDVLGWLFSGLLFQATRRTSQKTCILASLHP